MEVFAAHEQDILQGKLEDSLKDLIPSGSDLEEILSFTRASCYHHDSVVEVELAGYEIIHFLLDRLVPAALGASSSQARRLLNVLKIAERNGTYERLLAVTDYVSGMTDSYAIRTYRKLTGTPLPLR